MTLAERTITDQRILQPLILIPASIYVIRKGFETLKILTIHIKNKKRDGGDIDLLVDRRNLVQMSITLVALMIFAVLLVLFNNRNFIVWIIVDFGFLLVILKNFTIMRDYFLDF